MTTTKAKGAIARISYRAEWTDRGWIVWRCVAGKIDTSLPGRTHTREELPDKIATAQRADVAACTRLGLRAEILEHEVCVYPA
jgi:hypothetical protein